jgi:pullulanase/glycogen debranching enzyme
VTYNNKYNLSNGEDNRDGENHNLSWNCGEVILKSHASVSLVTCCLVKFLANDLAMVFSMAKLSVS